MQSQSRIFEDLARLMSNAAGVAYDARKELEIAVSSIFDRVMAKNNIVSREEFEAVRMMAVQAREENEALSQKISEMEKKIQPVKKT